MNKTISSLALALAVFLGGLTAAHATGRTTDKGYKTANKAALRGAAYAMNQNPALRETAGRTVSGGRKAILASQLVVKGPKKIMANGSMRFKVATQKLGPNGNPLATTVVNVRKVSKETQKDTNRAGRWVANTGTRTGYKVYVNSTATLKPANAQR